MDRKSKAAHTVAEIHAMAQACPARGTPAHALQRLVALGQELLAGRSGMYPQSWQKPLAAL